MEKLDTLTDLEAGLREAQVFLEEGDLDDLRTNLDHALLLVKKLRKEDK